MKMKIDIREKKLIELIKVLNKDYGYDIEIIAERLDLGDIIILDKDEEILIIERKSLPDLASSITDGRYTEQSYRLNKELMHNHNIIYLIEGDLDSYNDKYSKIKKKTLIVTMGCIQFFKGFSVMRTKDMMETAEYLLRFTDKLMREGKKSYYSGGKEEEGYSSIVTRVKKNNITPENIGEIMLNQIPGVSSTTSITVMKIFGSLINLIEKLKVEPKCLDNIKYTAKNGKERKISKTSIKNITQYLLYKVEVET